MFNEFFSELKILKKLGKEAIDVRTDLAKLGLAEKVTGFLSRAVLILTGLVTIWFVMLLLAVVLAQFLSEVMPSGFAYLIAAGMFVVLWVLLYLLRRPLLYNPICRTLTRMLFESKAEKARNAAEAKAQEEAFDEED